MTGMSDVEDFLQHFTDDAVWHLNRRRFDGHEGLTQITERARAAFPTGIEREVRSVVADGDRVVIQHTNRATTKDGREYLNEYVKVFEFAADGRCEFISAYAQLRSPP